MSWPNEAVREHNRRVSDDFVQYVAGYLKSEKSRLELRDNKALQDERIRQDHASEWWKALRDALAAFCVNSNQEIGTTVFQFDDSNDTNAVIPVWGVKINADIPSGHRELSVECIVRSSRVTYSVATSRNTTAGAMAPAGGGGQFLPVVEGSEFYYSDGSNRMHVNSMMQVMIKALLGITK